MYKLSSNFKTFSGQGPVQKKSGTAMKAIIELLNNGWSAPTDLKQIIDEYCMGEIKNLKVESLTFLIDYARFILQDHYINEEEYTDFIALKRIFKIGEGDFLQFKQLEVKEIVSGQMRKIYADHFVDKKEAIEKVNLQSLFDLSYEQFEMIKKDEVLSALSKGADPLDLDIATRPQ